MKNKLLKKVPSTQTLAICLVLLILFNLVLVSVLVKVQEEKRFYKDVERYVSSSCNEFGVQEAAVFAIIKAESKFDRYARSSADARGLMQITAVALKDINRMLSEDYTLKQMFDAEINVRCGVAYFSFLYQKYGNYSTAFAAYNAGQGNVDKWLLNGQYSYDQKELYYIPFQETRDYVKKVNHYYQEYQKHYGEN